MEEKFELTKAQIAFIKQKLDVKSLKDINIIIEIDSNNNKEYLEKKSSRFTKQSIELKGLCPPDYIVWKPTC